jgi:hypothetical protein
MRQLSEFLTEPVDFLKLSLDGHEWEALEDLAASGKLSSIRELVVVYHGRPQREQKLGAILELLAKHGYRYLIHDFDAQTNVASKPPFRLTPETHWSCLVYARRPNGDPLPHRVVATQP